MPSENRPERPSIPSSGLDDESTPGNRPEDGESATRFQVLGSGDQVVVLDAGFRNDPDVWAPVTAELENMALLLVINRGAAETSNVVGDAPRGPVVDQIEAITGTKRPGNTPIVVAWALGTVLAPSYAGALSTPARGLVFIDPVPPLLVREIYERFDEVARRGSAYASNLIAEIALARNYLHIEALSSSWIAAREVSIPRIHILRGERPAPGDALGNRWVDLVQQDRERITSVREVIAGRSGENIPRDRPDVIVDAVRDILVRSRD